MALLTRLGWTQKERKTRLVSVWSGGIFMAKIIIWVALAAFGFVAAVTVLSIPSQKAEADCDTFSC